MTRNRKIDVIIEVLGKLASYNVSMFGESAKTIYTELKIPSLNEQLFYDILTLLLNKEIASKSQILQNEINHIRYMGNASKLKGFTMGAKLLRLVV